MPRDIIDDRLVGALHLRTMAHQGFEHDPAADHVAFQVGTLHALMDGHLGGDTTIGELLAHGDLGIGTVQHLDGELVIIDGEPFVVDATGTVHAVDPETRTPFAVVCHFAPRTGTDLDGPLSLPQLRAAFDELLPTRYSVVAVRVDGVFGDLRLRSVHGQQRPYPPLSDVVAHQTEWSVPRARGTIVGFRFPDDIAGVEIPGHHLHFLSEDRRRGGHVLDVTVHSGHATVDGGDDLHVELPDHVELGTPGDADRGTIRAMEEG